MNATPAHPFRDPPRFGMALLASLLVVAAFAFVKFYLYAGQLTPLTFVLPLLVAAWHQHRRLHWAMATLLGVLAFWQLYGMIPADAYQFSRATAGAMVGANIVIAAIVVDWLLVSARQLRSSYQELDQINNELESTNEELAARDEEISSQNEELQSQAEEMEHQMEELQQQSEELQQQSEELQQQSEELQHLNEEGASRQRVLEALLETSTTPTAAGGVAAAASRICEAALEATGHKAAGAILVARDGEQTTVLGHCGVDLPAVNGEEPSTCDDPFVLEVIAAKRAAAIEDLAKTPDVTAPRGRDGANFRAALAAPIAEDGTAAGAIVLYSPTPHEWTQAEFKIAEWLAAQAGLVMLSARLQQEIDRRREQAEDESQRKTRFLAAVSHDVRTPANAISLTAEVIKQAGDDPKWAHEIPELAEALRANAKLLVELVSDVLDLARFDSGKVEVDATEFHLQDMVGKEVTQYQALAHSAGLRLEGSSEAGPIWLSTDRMKLARVLGNLIGNAIKFTDRGGVQVKCVRAADGTVEVHVVDTGVGIQPTHLENIFDEFYQIKNPERDRSKGTGLGLAICKRLVDAIGCSLVVRSRFGEGTTFTIRIPQELVIDPPTSAPPKPQQMQQQPPARRLSGLRVLLIEDHEDTRTAFSRLLGAHGAEVHLAHDGREAMRILGHHAPDVVLLDLMLPDMDGREVLKHLAANRTANLRCLLAVSGDVTDARRHEIEGLGADGLVAKPLQIEVLIERICETLRRAPHTPT
jgi:signal transduction histidine kinase/ActR/RegA family two-component response regulator/Skp family chaperone for outer membrane proteins